MELDKRTNEVNRQVTNKSYLPDIIQWAAQVSQFYQEPVKDYNTGFTQKPINYVGNAMPNKNKVKDEYLQGINLMVSNLRNEQEFRNLTDQQLKTIAQAAYNAGNAETGFMSKDWAKPGQTKDRLNRAIQSGTKQFGAIIGKINKAYSAVKQGDFLKAKNIIMTNAYTGNLSQYYKGNGIDREAVQRLRIQQLGSGPSVGVSQFKGSKYIVPTKYQDNPARSMRSNYVQDGINTAYALAKAYNTLKDKHLYYTNDALNKDQQIQFANDPSHYKVSKGEEIPIMAKLAYYWNQGAIPSSKTGQTGITNKKFIMNKRPSNYSSYPAAWGVR